MKAIESEGSLRIELERDGIAAGVYLHFVFDGDWCNLYDDAPIDEKEARAWFVQEVQWILEDKNGEASEGATPADGQASTEDRGAR